MTIAKPRTSGRLGALLGAALLLASLMVPASAAAAVDLNSLSATLEPGTAEDASGTVTLTLTPATGEICFTLDQTLPDIATDPPTSFDIDDQAGVLFVNLATVFDAGGEAAGCVLTTTEIVDTLLESPGLYQARVKTAVHTDAAIWGTLAWAYPQTHLDIYTLICPPNIQSVDDLTEAAAATCESVVLPADDVSGDVRPGYTAVGYAGTATFDYRVVDGVRIDETIDDASFTGSLSCNASTLECDGSNLPYRWSQLSAGATVNVDPTVIPAGTRVGAFSVFDGEGAGADLPTTLESDDSITIDATGVEVTNVVIYLFGDPLPDNVDPAVSTPVARFKTGSVFSSGAAVIDVRWTGSDVGSGLDHFVLQVSTDGGGYTTVDGDIATFKKTTKVTKGHSYRFRVRAVDVQGNVSGWKYSLVSNVRVVQDGNRRMDYTKSWKRTVDIDAAGDTVRRSGSKGAVAKLSFYGRAIAWVAPKGSAYGKAKIYIDGKLDATIDLSGATGDRVQVYKKTFSKNGGHTIRVKVVGTAGHPRVDIDAFLYLN